jgi:DNA primase
VKLKILALPNAKDPDELIRSEPGTWPSLVREATPVIDFVLQRLGGRHELHTAQGKRAAADEMLQVLAGIADPIEQDHFINEVARMLATRPETLRGMLRRSNQPARQPAPVSAPVFREGDPDVYLLALVMRLREEPKLLESVQTQTLSNVEFVKPEARALYQALGTEVPPELEPIARAAETKLPFVRRLTPREFQREIDRTCLEIKANLLNRQRLEISSSRDDTEVHRLIDELEIVRRAMDEVDQRRTSERESAGTR